MPARWISWPTCRRSGWPALIGEESPDLTPRAEVWTVLFNCGQDVLSDPLVRRALSLAVDRSAAAAAAGAAALPAEGLVPWGVRRARRRISVPPAAPCWTMTRITAATCCRRPAVCCGRRGI